MVDNARKTTSELECHIQGVTAQVINNAQSATAATVAGCMDQLTAVRDVFDGRVTSLTHDINDNANALAVYFNLELFLVRLFTHLFMYQDYAKHQPSS